MGRRTYVAACLLASLLLPSASAATVVSGIVLATEEPVADRSPPRVGGTKVVLADPGAEVASVPGELRHHAAFILVAENATPTMRTAEDLAAWGLLWRIPVGEEIAGEVDHLVVNLHVPTIVFLEDRPDDGLLGTFETVSSINASHLEAEIATHADLKLALVWCPENPTCAPLPFLIEQDYHTMMPNESILFQAEHIVRGALETTEAASAGRISPDTAAHLFNQLAEARRILHMASEALAPYRQIEQLRAFLPVALADLLNNHTRELASVFAERYAHLRNRVDSEEQRVLHAYEAEVAAREARSQVATTRLGVLAVSVAAVSLLVSAAIDLWTWYHRPPEKPPRPPP